MTETRVPAGVPTGGQFAASARAESAVVLMTEPHDGHGPNETCPGCPHGAEPHPIATILRDAGLPGTVEEPYEGQVRYTTPDGHAYTLTGGENTLVARAEGVDGFIANVRLAGPPSTPAMTSKKVLEALDDLHGHATDVRAMNRALSEWLATPENQRGYGWSDPDLDDYEGAATFSGVTVGGFMRKDFETGGPALIVTIAEPGVGDDGVEFKVARDREGRLAYLRADDEKHPLESWERQAVDSEVTNRLNRSGFVSGLGELLNVAVRHANAAPTLRST